jgi:site-specific recombinase XerD
MTDQDRLAPLRDDPETRRALQLDSLSAILPPDRRDRLAGVLTDDEVATLRHLAKEGMGTNTLRAMASDLGYLEAWSRVANDAPLPWPATEAILLRFIAHHLWNPAERANDPAHGMPAGVDSALRAGGYLRVDGPHAPATVRRRLALWSTFHRWRGLEGPFGAPNIRNTLRLATRAARRPRKRKSALPVTRSILDRLLESCAGERLIDKRDRALLLLAFASGGRRRSEIARLAIEDLVDRPPVAADPTRPRGALLPAMALRLGRTKTASDDDDERVLVVGRPVDALLQWITAASIASGPLFRSIDRWGNLGSSAIDGQSVNAIVKARCHQVGLDEVSFSAHGLRSGYMTEAARRGVPLQEAMRQSRHRSVQQAAAYYNEVEIERGNSARLG